MDKLGYVILQVNLSEYQGGKYVSARLSFGKRYKIKGYSTKGFTNYGSYITIINNKNSVVTYDSKIFRIISQKELREEKLKGLLCKK